MQMDLSKHGDALSAATIIPAMVALTAFSFLTFFIKLVRHRLKFIRLQRKGLVSFHKTHSPSNCKSIDLY